MSPPRVRGVVLVCHISYLSYQSNARVRRDGFRVSPSYANYSLRAHVRSRKGISQPLAALVPSRSPL